MFEYKKLLQRLQFLGVPAALNLLMTISPLTAAPANSFGTAFTFDMVVSAGAKTCVPNANARSRQACAGLR